MIHRESRDSLAQALRQYVSGRITNDELADIEFDWRDRGAVAVYQMAWQLYDDTHNHRVEGRFPRNSADRRTIARWITFLHSDQEYLWPEYSFMQIINWPMNLITLGWWERSKKKRWEEFLEAGDFNVWPYCSRTDLERVVKRPRLLRGNTQQTNGTDA